MQSEAWIELFKIIPESTHNTLVIVTTSGVEVSLEMIIRFEPTYLVCRGRMSGSTDERRVFFVPYDMMVFVKIEREVRENEVRAMYGMDLVAERDLSKEDPDSPPSLTDEPKSKELTKPPEPAKPAAAVPVPAAGAVEDPATIARNNLLQRIRATRETMSPKPPPK